jgi:Uma2 family endonuclease
MEAPAIVHPLRPRHYPLSYEEYLALPAEAQLVEWADGEVLFHMPPTPVHQIIVIMLSRLIGGYADQLGVGSILVAPLEVKLWPDILFVAKDNLARIGDKRFDGAPDLIVEVISPTSVTLDRIRKFREYEQAGVGEYWIIDPRPFQQQADFYVRDDDGSFIPAPVGDDGVYASRVLTGFRLRVEWLWQSPQVNPQRALAEMLAEAPGLSEELRAAYRELLRLLP